MAVTDLPLSKPLTVTRATQGGAPGRTGSAADADRHLRAGPGTTATYGLLGLLLVIYATSLILRHTGDTTTLVDGWGVATFELLVSLLVVARAIRYRTERGFASWLGLGMCSWAIGDFAMTIETLNGASPATLSAANVLWYGFFPLTYVGVMVLMRRDVRKFTLADYLDGVIACLITAALFAAFAFQAIVKASGGDSGFATVNVVYPLGDLLLLVLVTISIALLPSGKRARWSLMALACLVNAAGDVAALFPGVVATHAGFLMNSWAWPASLYLISASTWITGTPSRSVRDHQAAGFLVPTIASALALIVLFVGSLEHIAKGALGLATLTLLAGGVRCALALRRLRSLTEEKHRELADVADSERESREALQATVRQYSEFAARVADGDLRATVEVGRSQELHELAGSLNRMVSGLAEISGEIQQGVQQLGGATAEILTVVSEHNASATQQSAAIQETTATVNELRSAADAAARRARLVAEHAGASLQVSDEGTRAVASIAEAMQDIRARVEAIAGDIENLSARTEQIGEITATVNALADRSNLLALNASIEAARAGEHGRGFAVVADQVRSLAEQSKQATGQVEAILADIRSATAAAVRAGGQGSEVVAQGLELAQRAGDGIRSLTSTIRDASSAAEEIAASVSQQSAGMDQIAHAMQSISDGTTRFVAGAEQSQQAAERLNDLAGTLSSLTERYQV